MSIIASNQHLLLEGGTLRDLIQDALKGHDADYLEIRVEEALASHIRYSNMDLEDIGISSSPG